VKGRHKHGEIAPQAIQEEVPGSPTSSVINLQASNDLFDAISQQVPLQSKQMEQMLVPALKREKTFLHEFKKGK